MDAHNPSPAHCLEMAHVLFMDIVAYSTLHMDHQESVLGELQEAVRTTAEFARAQADDQLIRLPTGDGMALVFFHDPEAPVRCALELSRILRDHPDIKLRMGIHSGPVYRIADINANRNVAGGGINIAQRVMDCGDAGHILISNAEAEVLGQCVPTLAIHRLQLEHVSAAQTANRSGKVGFAASSLAKLAGNLGREFRVRRTGHQLQSLLHFAVGEKIQQRRLPQRDVESCFQRVVKDWIARSVCKIGKDDRVLFGQGVCLASIE